MRRDLRGRSLRGVDLAPVRIPGELVLGCARLFAAAFGGVSGGPLAAVVLAVAASAAYGAAAWRAGRPSPVWLGVAGAVLLSVAFFIISAVPALRNFFALVELTPFEWVLVCGATIIWMFAVRFFWRHSITARFLGIQYA